MRRTLALVSLMFVGLAGTAGAGTLNVSAISGEVVGVTSHYATGQVFAGTSTIWNIHGLDPLDGTSFSSFCVDLQHGIKLPEYNQQTQLDLMSNWSGYGWFTPQANAGRYAAYLYNTYTAGLADDAQRAGLQLAIWNVLNDNDFSVKTAGVGVGTNTFVATGSAAAIAAAELYLAGLQANLDIAATSDAYWLRLYDGTNPNASPQDFIGPKPVPDGGATLMLLGGALLSLGALRSKFRG